MVEVKNWDEFFEQTKELMRQNPSRTRYSIKYKTKPGAALVIKITDNSTVLKFTTSERSDLKRIEELTGWMLAAMTEQEQPHA
ncbi:Signal recognition particle 9 kDa protein [Porphyridium purpureum]|uniref:Signal recognition particle 9 kDa protein n=1 Tax=Porphyridium purpureum TaxID=35688 RepID=A0A5J4Z1T7_PORPP|nr:Signal recognition particle 9 kDa protein [Porphyridium purpureum]|eukprot:POR1743..scf208_2